MLIASDIENIDLGKSNKYFIPSSLEETERLSILHKVFFEPTKRFLALSGVSENNSKPLSVADVGCGTGQMTKWLSENINGYVIGFDNDEKQITKAFLNVSTTNSCTVNFDCLDIQSDIQYFNMFDLVYCRFVLHHLSNPLNGLTNLINMAKVGGKIVIGEPIMDGRWIYPDCSEYYEIYNLHLKNQSGHVWDPNYGKKLLSDLSNYNNIKITHCEQFRPILSSENVKRHHLLVLDIFGDEFVKNGLITARRLCELKCKALAIAGDDRYKTDLFGLVLVCLEKF